MGLSERFPALSERIKTRPVRRLAADRFIRTLMKLIHKTQDEGKHLMSREEVDERLTSYLSKFIEVDGYRIHYRDEGEGFPIVLLHGFAASLQVWNDWARVLKKKFRVIRLDMPGFALSDSIKPGTQLSVDFFTLALHNFLKQLGIEKFHLAGNSLGGWISWEFASKYPQRINKLVLLNAAGYLTPETHPKGIKMLTRPEVQKLVKSGVPRIMVRMMVRNSFGDKKKMNRDIVDRHYALVNREGNLASLFKIAMAEIYPQIGKIKEISAPTLILWGQKDKVVDVEYAHKFAGDIPENKLIIYEKVGHIPMVEIPQKSVEDLLDFLDIS